MHEEESRRGIQQLGKEMYANRVESKEQHHMIMFYFTISGSTIK